MATLISACATSAPSVHGQSEKKVASVEIFRPTMEMSNIDYSADENYQNDEIQSSTGIDEPPLVIPDEQKYYPPRVYGAPLPMVCKHLFPAKDELADRPNLQLMWEHYLYENPKSVWALIGGAVEINGYLPEDKGGWRNACTVRLSHMLNKAEHRIPAIEGQTVSGRTGEQYFFRLDDAQIYLERVFGAPDVDIKDASGHWIDIPEEPGLLILKFPGLDFTGHATIWNGAGTVDGTDVVGFRILYWKLPCFLPPDRKQSS